jgi:CxxC-x17-CxxC domain-containing protein
LIRNIIGQSKSSIDVRKAMDEGKVLIMNFSKGHIGEDNSALLGAMMITKIQLAAMSRVDIPEKERKDFYLYIDEFQNFSTDSFANILSEARKYHLSLIIAHQYIEQLTDTVKAAVFGNVGTLVSFRVGAVDAEELVKEFAPVFTEEDILNLPKFEFYVKLMIDGVASTPFSARGLLPLREDEKTYNFEKAVEWTRRNYAKDRVLVEEEIMHSHFQDEPSPNQVNPGQVINVSAPQPSSFPPVIKGAFPPAARNFPPQKSNVSEQQGIKPQAVTHTASILNQDPVEAPAAVQAPIAKPVIRLDSDNSGSALNDATCSNCGNQTKVPFKPDGTRPIYCKHCLSELKKKKKEEIGEKKIMPSRPNFSDISPSALGRDSEIEPVEPSSLSLSALSDSSLVNFSKNSHNHKNPLPDQKEVGIAKEKELAEGEDIIFD